MVSGFSDAANATTAIDYIHVSGLIDDILDDDVNTLGLNTALDDAAGSGLEPQQLEFNDYYER